MKNKRPNLYMYLIFIVITILLASCSGSEASSLDIVTRYYNAIEAKDADAAAALFTEDAHIVTPSGNTVNGDSIRSTFIQYDLNFMDRVDFQTDFTESDGKITWTQEWHHVDGGSLLNDCEITIRDGKIAEWIFN